MYHFFVTEDAFLDDKIVISNEDVNHIKNVLRLKVGEQVIISRKDVEDDCDYYCSLLETRDDSVLFKIDWTEEGRELDNKIYLIQGLPKSDKMELIIQKAVELGVYEIIPYQAKRSVVKLDGKKALDKRKRWQAIAESAAKQSKRSIIPQIGEIMDFNQVMDYVNNVDVKLMPYENAKGIEFTREKIKEIAHKQSVAILIGPEGGFEESEVTKAKESGFLPVSLGKRILRTETAGFMMLSVLMFTLEK